MKLFANTLIATEEELEADSVQKGIERYNDLIKEATTRGEGASLAASQRLLVYWYQAFLKLVRRERRDCDEHKVGVGRGIYAKYMRMVDPAETAVIVMHTVVGMCLANPAGITCTKIVLAIGRNLNANILRKLYKRPSQKLATVIVPYGRHKGKTLAKVPRSELRNLYANPQRRPTATSLTYLTKHPDQAIQFANDLDEFMKARESYGALMHTDRKQIKPKGVLKVSRRFYPEKVWPLRAQGHIGAALLKHFIDVAVVHDKKHRFYPAFDKYMIWRRRRSYWYLRLTPEADKIVRDGHAYLEVLHPGYQPMVVHPVAWTMTTPGGYLKHTRRAIKKSRKPIIPKNVLNDTIFNFLNTVSGTPWRINKRILEVAQALREQGGNVPGIPRASEIPKPPVPPDIDTDPDVKKAWKREAAQIYNRNVGLKGERVVAWKKFDIAERFKEYERIYFPHDLDFRGRAYAIPLFLNHQGDDLCRGMLEFAAPKSVSMNDNAKRWLAIHMANCCGVDRISFDDRHQWARDNRERFLAWDMNPLDCSDWLEVDKPFQALATAFAMHDLPDAASRLPIQVDGSNNALQHYGAMLRCPETAALVNLIPSEMPADVYADVAERTARLVAADAEKGNKYALKLESWITRKVVKQTVMTSVYGVTAVGARRQVHEHLKKAGFVDDELYQIARYLSKEVRKAVSHVCVAAHEAMAWLTRCARIITKAKQSVRWISPIGMHVEQPYRNTRRFSVQTILHELWVAEMPDDAPPHVRRQNNGFAPNFVHAIDASHLMLTANKAREANIQTAMHFAGVHDSFWTHAADMDVLGRLLREAFVELHQMPLLEDLWRQLQCEYSDLKFPPPPEMGSFDIKQVLDSDYFFS